jgi:hypothetical protein
MAKTVGHKSENQLQEMKAVNDYFAIRMAELKQLDADVWGMTRRLVGNFEKQCDYLSVANQQGWINRLLDAVKAKAEIISQASFDSWGKTGKLFYQAFYLPMEYDTTQEGIPAYVEQLYRKYTNDKQAIVGFSKRELAILSLGEYVEKEQDIIL